MSLRRHRLLPLLAHHPGLTQVLDLFGQFRGQFGLPVDEFVKSLHLFLLLFALLHLEPDVSPDLEEVLPEDLLDYFVALVPYALQGRDLLLLPLLLSLFHLFASLDTVLARLL